VPVYIQRTRRTWCLCTVHAGRASWRRLSFFLVTELRLVNVTFHSRLLYTGLFSTIISMLCIRCWRYRTYMLTFI